MLNFKKDFLHSPSYDSLVNLLRQRAYYQPNRIAYTFLKDGETKTHSLTYSELDHKARLIGGLLQNLGLTRKRALLLYPPGLEFIAAFFGCLYAGVIAIPAYPPRRNQSLERFQAIVKDSQATEVLTTASIWKNVEQNFAQQLELSSLRWLATDNIDGNLAPSWQEPRISRDSLAFLQYTSGSTGNPKGVMVSHGNLIHNLSLIEKKFGHKSDRQGVIWLPPYHDMGLIGGILQPLYVGFPVVLMSPVVFLQKPFRWLQAISKYRATTSGGPNFAYDLCVNKITEEQKASLDLSSWEVAFTGAEPVRAETLERFAHTFAPCGFRREAFYPCYGMAETTLFVTGGRKTTPPVIQTVMEAQLEKNQVVFSHEDLPGTRKLVGVGKTHLEQKFIIVDPDRLTRCPVNRVGEIWVSGPSVAQGYWQQPQKTEQTFNAYTKDTKEGPFLRTGDLGFVREDGELFITGRLKDLIIIRGRNHYPQDIELTVEKSHSSIRPGCGAAFALEINGQEKLVVVVELERRFKKRVKTVTRNYQGIQLQIKRRQENIDPGLGVEFNYPGDYDDILNSIRQAVVKKYGLKVDAIQLLRMGSIPKTSSGKIRRSSCRTKFLEGTLDVVAKSASTEEFRKVKVTSAIGYVLHNK